MSADGQRLTALPYCAPHTWIQLHVAAGSERVRAGIERVRAGSERVRAGQFPPRN